MKSASSWIGDIGVYGSWDDVTDNQFLVLQCESGRFADVILLSGSDYGGGVTSSATNIPYEVVEEILKRDLTDFDTKREMEALVDLYNEKG